VNGRQDLLRLEGVEKQYSRQRILHVDNLMLREGDLVEISGANGSGKSTLLKLLGGITPADHGCIWRAPVMKSSVLAACRREKAMTHYKALRLVRSRPFA
jgi:ABC-type sugar transport system ATPase subunit